MNHPTLTDINTNIRRLTTENLLLMKKIRGCTWRLHAGYPCDLQLEYLQKQHEDNEELILELCEIKQDIAYKTERKQGSDTAGLNVGNMLTF